MAARKHHIPKAASPKLGKPVSHHQSVHHSTHVDEKGKKHHRVHVSTETSYEYGGEPKTLMDELLNKRGY